MVFCGACSRLCAEEASLDRRCTCEKSTHSVLSFMVHPLFLRCLVLPSPAVASEHQRQRVWATVAKASGAAHWRHCEHIDCKGVMLCTATGHEFRILENTKAPHSKPLPKPAPNAKKKHTIITQEAALHPRPSRQQKE